MEHKILADDKRFYINDEQGKLIAEISFVPSGDKLTIIDHTWVDESLKGRASAKAGGAGGREDARGAA